MSEEVDLGEAALFGHSELIGLPYLVLDGPAEHEPSRQLLVLKHLLL